MDLRPFFDALPVRRLGVAVSGGGDSTALLIALAEWSERPFSITALHANHRLRGGDSDADEQFVRDLCGRLGVEIRVAEVPPDPERIRASGVENAAREARRAALLTFASQLELDAIATAHHADDQAETVLLAILRGGGARRLAGIRPVDLPWVRPLIEMRRADIESFLNAREVRARLDSTNAETRFLRNRIRHELLPLLESLQPKVVEHLGEITRQLRESELEVGKRESEWRNRWVRHDGELVNFSIQGISESSFLFRRVLLDSAFAIDPTARELSASDLRRIAAHAGESRSALQITKNLRLVRRGDELALERVEREKPPFTELEVALDSAVDWAPLGWRLRIRAGREGEASFVLPETGGQLRLRTRLPGDRWHPPRSSTTKKLKDEFIERKIDRTLRERLPILTWNGNIVWVAKLGVSKEFLPRDGSAPIFSVEVLESD